jgi:hypothetical protein
MSSSRSSVVVLGLVIGKAFTIWYATTDGVPDWDRIGAPLE